MMYYNRKIFEVDVDYFLKGEEPMCLSARLTIDF